MKSTQKMNAPSQTLNETDSTPRTRSGLHFWKTAGVVLAVLVSAGAVAGVVGKAFYVTREEYTEKVKQDSMSGVTIQNTMERLNGTMLEQKTSFDKLSDQLGSVKTDIAVIKSRTKRGPGE